MKIAGLDIGTTGCKLTVFTTEGGFLERGYRDYPIKRSGREHEVDARAILESVWELLCQMAEKYPDIGGIGVTSFGETFVAADENGMPLYPAMLYTDPRGKEECAKLTEKLGREKLLHITGVDPHEMYSISKMMWLKKNEPAVFEKVRHLFLIEDFIVFHLTGRAQIDYSLATRTQAFDIAALTWSDEILKAAQIDKTLLSEPVLSGTAAGVVAAQAAQKTHLSPDTVIVSISHDQVAAAIGAGVFTSDTAVDGAGTVQCIVPVYDTLPDLDVMSRGKFAVVPYAVPGKYVCYAFSYTGGALLNWCVNTLAKKEKEAARVQGKSVYTELEKDYREPTGLLVLPHFAGAATPYMDTASRGAILGLETSTTLETIYQGCMEGVVYEMLVNMEYLKNAGTSFSHLHATGGGAGSALFLQMKADMLNLPVTALETVDAGTVGSAMLTGIAIGCFKDLSDAAGYMVKKKETYYPRSEMHEKYQRIYQRYRQVYGAVRPLVEENP